MCTQKPSTEQQGANSEQEKPAAPVEITLKVWAPDNQQELLKKQTAAFQEANKDKWTITWDLAAVGEDDAKTQVLNDADAAADVFMYASDNTAALVNAGVIAKLGGATLDMIKSTMSQTIVDTVTIGGDVYAIPFTHNTWYVYYDKSIMTADDVKTMEGIMGKQTAEGVYNFKIDGGGWYMGAWYYGAGLSLFGPDGTNLDAGCDYNTAKGVAVTNYLIDLLSNTSKVDDEIDIASNIKEHKLGVWFDGAWNYNTYKEILGDDLGMAQLPTFTVDGETIQMRAFYSSKAIAVNAKSKNMAAAIAFANYLGSEEQQIARFKDSEQIPTNNNAAALEEVQASPVAQVILAVAANTAVAQPGTAEFGAGYWDNAAAIVGDIQAGKCTKENVQEYLDTLVKAMTGK